jgi:hypothetical protein
LRQCPPHPLPVWTDALADAEADAVAEADP